MGGIRDQRKSKYTIEACDNQCNATKRSASAQMELQKIIRRLIYRINLILKLSWVVKGLEYLSSYENEKQ